MTIFKTFTFDSAHYLPNVPEDHKCRTMHGHTYKLTVYAKGHIDPDMGWIMDFSELQNKVKEILKIVDHKVLNNIPGLGNPTCENLTRWLWKEIRECVPLTTKVELWETPSSGAIFEG